MGVSLPFEERQLTKGGYAHARTQGPAIPYSNGTVEGSQHHRIPDGGLHGGVRLGAEGSAGARLRVGDAGATPDHLGQTQPGSGGLSERLSGAYSTDSAWVDQGPAGAEESPRRLPEPDLAAVQ